MAMKRPHSTGAIAVWAITPDGAALAKAVADAIAGSDLFVSASLAEGYQRTADEREMLKSVIRTSLSRKISGRIFDLRLASVFEREPLSANDAAIPMTATEAG